MMTTAAISPITRNVLSIEKIEPMAVKATQSARIAPRILQIIRLMHPVCTRRGRPAGYGKECPGQLAEKPPTSLSASHPCPLWACHWASVSQSLSGSAKLPFTVSAAVDRFS